MSVCFDPDQAGHVDPDLGPNCLERLTIRRLESRLARKELNMLVEISSLTRDINFV